MKNDKFIISASRRTDIPAFHAQWFQQRLEKGFCDVANPFNLKQISRVSLLPENVTAFIFWTRNPEPFFSTLEKLLKIGYHCGFMVTATGYPNYLEPCSPKSEKIDAIFEQLCKTIGKEKVIWRYDPIIFSEFLTPEWHLSNFASLADRIRPFSNTCIISLVDFYRKTLTKLRKLKIDKFIERPFSLLKLRPFFTELKAIADSHQLNIQSCCETESLLSDAGIDRKGCINPEWIEKITKKKCSVTKHKGQRKSCLCAYSKDIGNYGTCRHGCIYCYAM